MKYIPKKYQIYFDKDQKKEYNQLLLKRRIENNRWKDLPYLPKKDEIDQHCNIVNAIEKRIYDLEFEAYENAEKTICKEGNIVVSWWRGERWKLMVVGKVNRDHYKLVDINSTYWSTSNTIHWKTLVRMYRLSDIMED